MSVVQASELPRFNQYRGSSPYDYPTHGYNLRIASDVLQRFSFSKTPEQYFTPEKREDIRQEMDAATQRFAYSHLMVMSRRENCDLIMACVNNQLDRVRLLVPTKLSVIRGGEQRLERRGINIWTFNLDEDDDEDDDEVREVRLCYDPGAFWLDNPDKRLYGRSRESGTGPLQWDRCFSTNLRLCLHGHTALTAASEFGSDRVVEHLLSITPLIPHVQDIRIPKPRGGPHGNGDLPCHLAARGGHLKTLRQILLHSSPVARGVQNPQFRLNHDRMSPFTVALRNVLRVMTPPPYLGQRSDKACMILLACHGDVGVLPFLNTNDHLNHIRVFVKRCWNERNSPNIVIHWNKKELARVCDYIVRPVVDALTSCTIPDEVCGIIATFLCDSVEPPPDVDAKVPIKVVDALYEATLNDFRDLEDLRAAVAVRAAESQLGSNPRKRSRPSI